MAPASAQAELTRPERSQSGLGSMPAVAAGASVFHSPWWLNEATNGSWELLTAGPRSGFVCQLPLVLKRRFGLSYSGMPVLTRTLGPVFRRAEVSQQSAVLSDRVRHALTQDLMDIIPAKLAFSQVFDPDCGDLSAFAMNGFTIQVAYTFRIEDTSNPDAIWGGMKDKSRNVIRRSQEKLRVAWDKDAGRFVDFYVRALASWNETPRWRPDHVRRLLTRTADQGAGTALYCIDSAGTTLAGVFLVWDDHHCYYLLSARDKACSDNGSMNLLVWEAIQEAGRRQLRFDFDGFRTTGAGRFVTQFGARSVPRWWVRRVPAWVQAIEALLRKE